MDLHVCMKCAKQFYLNMYYKDQDENMRFMLQGIKTFQNQVRLSVPADLQRARHGMQNQKLIR